MTFYIAPIVEGHAEDGCVAILLHRVWQSLLGAPIRLQVLKPSRGQHDALVDPKHPQLTQKIEEAYSKLAQRMSRDSDGRGALLLLLDAERDCPATLGPSLIARARLARSNIDVFCILAKRMLENWIVAGCSTLAGVNGLPPSLPSPADPEACHGAGWLDDQLRIGNRARKYKKTADSEPFVRAMSLLECRTNSPSFDKLCRELAARLPPPVEPPPQTDASNE